MKRHSVSSSRSVIAAGLLIVAVMVAMLIGQPVHKKVGQLSEELAAKTVSLSELQAEVARLQSLEANLPVAETERARFLKAVPVEFNQDGLVNDLDVLARRVGISLNAMSFSPQTSLTSAQTVAVTANFTGRYVDLISLLEALETNARLLKVGSIGVQLSDRDENGDQLMNFSVTLEAYYQ